MSAMRGVMVLASLLWAAHPGQAQVTQTFVSLESEIAQSEVVFSGSITKLEKEILVPPGGMRNGSSWPDGIVRYRFQVQVQQVIKGELEDRVQLERQTSAFDPRWTQWQDQQTEFLWFLPAEQENQKLARNETWKSIRIGKSAPGESSYRTPSLPVFSMDLSVIRTRKDLLAHAKKFSGQHPETVLVQTIEIPRVLAAQCSASADGNYLVLPIVPELEQTAKQLLISPQAFLPSEQKLDDLSRLQLRLAGMELLRSYSSPENTKLLIGFLEDETVIQVVTPKDESGKPSLLRYPLRKAAYNILKSWDQNPAKPILEEPLSPENNP